MCQSSVRAGFVWKHSNKWTFPFNHPASVSGRVFGFPFPVEWESYDMQPLLTTSTSAHFRSSILLPFLVECLGFRFRSSHVICSIYWPGWRGRCRGLSRSVWNDLLFLALPKVPRFCPQSLKAVETKSNSFVWGWTSSVNTSDKS